MSLYVFLVEKEEINYVRCWRMEGDGGGQPKRVQLITRGCHASCVGTH